MKYPQRSSSAAWRLVDGEVVIADAATSRACVLNGSGSAAWMLAGGTRDVRSIAAEIEGLAEDEGTGTAVFFDALSEAGLVTMLERPAPSPASGFPPAGLEELLAATAATHEPPRILSSEPLQVLATTCDSAYGGEATCRTAVCGTPLL